MKPKRIISVVDTHTAGEPTRIALSGLPNPPGATMKEKQTWLAKNQDQLRRFLMAEPRGHKDMFGALVTQPANPEAQVGVVFMDSSGYVDMCGHGTIGLVTVLLDLGYLASPEVVLDTPAGLVRARAELSEDGVARVTIRNVPSFLHSLAHLEVEGLGEVNLAAAYGGNYFALVDVKPLGLELNPANLDRLIGLGLKIRQAANKSLSLAHPATGQPGEISLVEFYDESDQPCRNLVVFGAGQFDRSPCGTGTCAKMAYLHAQGRLKVGQEYRHQSIIGTQFIGRVVGETSLGPKQAIIPEITGSAYITGLNQLILDKNDPLGEGFAI